MDIFKNNTQINIDENPIETLDYSKEFNITKLKMLLILIFPFATFFGSYINIIGINISHLYSIILCISVLKSLLKLRYKYIAGYIGFFFVMILYAFASLIWGKYDNVGLPIVLPLLTCFVAMTFISSLNEIELQLFLKSLSMFTIVVLIISLIEIFTGRYLLFNNVDFINRVNLYKLYYPGVVFANPNDLAQYLLVGFPLLIFMNFEKKSQPIVPILLFFITIFVLINTSSRLSLISTVIIVVFYIMVSMFNKENKFLKYFGTLSLSVILFVVLTYFGFELSKYDILNNFLKVDSSKSYFSGRATIYYNVFKLGLNNMLFGAGLGGSYTVSVIGTHNMFLFIFADLGIYFVIGFTIVLVSAFLFLYKHKSLNICACHLNKIILAILIIFPIFSSISSGNEQRKIIWILLGIVFSLISNSKIKYSNTKQNNI